MDNEELMETLRAEAVEYSAVTDAIKADMGDDINDDVLAVFYRAKSTNDKVLRQGLELQFGSALVGQLEKHFDDVTAPEPVEPPKPDSLLGKVGSGVVSTARGTVETIADVPDIAGATVLSVATRRANFFERMGEKAFNATLGKIERDVQVNPITEATQALLLENGIEAELGATSVRMPMAVRNKLIAEQYTGGEASSLSEVNKGIYDQMLAEQEAKLENAGSEFAYALSDWATEFALIPGPAKLGKWGMAASAALRGAAADNIVYEEGDQTLIMMAETLGLPEAEFLDIIRTDDEKSAWQNRLAITIEGAGLGMATDAIFATVNALRKVHRGGDAAEAMTEATEVINRNLSEAKEARMLTQDEINGAAEGVGAKPLPEPEVELTASDLLNPPVQKVPASKIKADTMLDRLIEVDLDELGDDGIESLAGIRKFSEWSDWDDVAGARVAINEHLTGLFDRARKSQTIESMIKKTEKVRQRQLKDGAPDWAKMVINDEASAKAYVNNMIVEQTIAKQVNAIAEWTRNGSRAAELPPFLEHLKNVDPQLRKAAIAGYTNALFESATVIGKKNATQISEHARALATQRWIKAGALKDAQKELDLYIEAQKKAGNPDFADSQLGLQRIADTADGTLSTFRQMVEHVKAGETLNAVVRFRNANMLANQKTMAINAISEAFGHTQAGSISRIYQGLTQLSKGKALDGAGRIALGLSFGIRQFSQFGKSWDNAMKLFQDGIGEVAGSASAFDSGGGKQIGETFGGIFNQSGNALIGSLNVATAGVNRTIAAISELFSSMAVYQKMQDDALLGAFGDKYKKLAAEGLTLRAMTREQITQMFVDNKHPALLLRKTRAGNLIDKGAADNAAIIGFREGAEYDGISDAAIGAMRKFAHKSKVSGALFDFFAPFARTITKISRRALQLGMPSPLWFVSTQFRKRFFSDNPAVRQLARAEFALSSAVYTGFLAKGLLDEDADERRREKIASLENPGDSVVIFEPVDETIGFNEDFQGWVKVTMKENGKLETNYFLPQELNVFFSTAIAAQSVGRYLRDAAEGDHSDKNSVGHYFHMAAAAGTTGVTQNNLIANFLQGVDRSIKALTSFENAQTWLAMNIGSFTPGAPAVKHLSADYDKLFGDGESMQFNSALRDDREMKFSENFAFAAAYRQLTRMDVKEYLNVKRGPFGSPLPTRGRGVALIAKSAEVGQGEMLFSDFLQNEIGVDPTRLPLKVIEGGIDLKEIRVADDQRSLGDQILQRLSEVTINGVTIDERMLEEFTSPTSGLAVREAELQESVEYAGPEREGIEKRTAEVMTDREDYLLSIYREYLNAAKEQVMFDMPMDLRLLVEDRIAQTQSDYDLMDKHYGGYKMLLEQENPSKKE